MLRLALVSTQLVVLLGAASGPPPSADPWGSVDCSQNPGPGCDLSAGHSGQHDAGTPGDSGGSAHTGGDDGSACRYVPVDYQDPGGQPSGPGGWFMVLCSPDGKDPLSHGPVWLANGAGGGPALSPAQLAQLARKRLRLPQPRIVASPTGDQLVHLPTWLWLSDGWQQVSASASVPGLSVTAVAKPTSVSWSMGDGGVVDCVGPGTPYRETGNPRAASPDCGYAYRTSSAFQPNHAFQVTATVRWTVSWSGGGQSGVFSGLTTSSITRYRVAQSLALGNG